ncbi:MAG: S1 family peptidase [Gemmataceae bacterium]
MVPLCFATLLPFWSIALTNSTDFSGEVQTRTLWATPRILATSGEFGTCSGITLAIKDNVAYVLTAAHGVEGAAEREVQYYTPNSYPLPEKKFRNVVVVMKVDSPDVALLKVPVGDFRPPVLKLTKLEERPRRFPVPVLAAGCSDGGAPTLWADRLLSRRLVRPPNLGQAFFWETARPTIVGRSGGALVDTSGNVLGLCSATQGGQGYYTFLDEILVALKKNEYAWLMP